MKFGKELRAQMVQEWQRAYVDYSHLKKLLKDIIKQNSGRDRARTGFWKTNRTMHIGLTPQTNNIAKSPQENMNENEEILESPTRQQAGSEICFQTLFSRSSEEGGELEQIFLGKLDDEFNKVVKFYTWKAEEVKLRAEKLNKQMDALIALRIRVDKPYVDPSVVNQGGVHRDNTNKEADQMSNESTFEDEITAEKDNKDAKAFKSASLEILDYVKINVNPETPRSTLRKVIKSSKSEPSFSEEELSKAETKLRRAFIDFYQQLRLLKSYRNTSNSYLEIVDRSYLGSSDEVNTLMERLETTFIKHFAKGNRRKGMNFLRPREKKERHSITFFLALFAGIIVTIHARNLLNHEGRDQYMSNIFPLYSLFLYIVLHMLMYGANTYFWRRYRVNYPFIFGYKPGTEMGFREIFLLASGLSMLAFAAVLANLDMEMDPDTQSYILRFLLGGSANEPGALVIQPRRSNTCLESEHYEKFYIAVAIIPFMARVLQCLRQVFEQKNVTHGLNGLKYFSTIVALVMRTMYSLRRRMFWRIMAASTSGITTIYNTYWDIVRDWGLLRKNAKNKWLRDNLLISSKAVYFLAIVSGEHRSETGVDAVDS
ncbi:phosphate transporter pho1 homolog 5 [Phtheirospermum japonicum]|uniref:Phosphate transporter pho1 homolog 5 n=1 Tax=Phtheirospermum japonicum TaxID=374723 RepID=A0A830C7Z9_9LAMI|nr:phosphate transporter pho1 homolog 5 [Phtheirospermum japonicum]